MTGRDIDVADSAFQLGELKHNATVRDSWAEECEPESRLTLVFEQPPAFEGMLRFAKLVADANTHTPSKVCARGFLADCVLRVTHSTAASAVDFSAVGSCPDWELRPRAA